MIYKLEQEIPNEQYLTYDQMNIIISFQKMWLKIALWIRTYIKASIFDTPNLKSTTNYLFILPSEFYPIFSMFYGTEVAQNLVNILLDFIKSAMKVIESMKYGDKVLTGSRITEWYQVADKLSSYLARINIYWDENQWKYFLYQYIKLKVDEIRAIVNGNFEEEIELFERIEDVIFLMSSYMARGIISSNLKRITNQ